MIKLSDFLPKWVTCLREGYSRGHFFHDLCAGMSVGIIALPLALAFAIASGVTPDKGLFTAIVAGFLISALGGSRTQIGGPTGAFVVIVYSIVERHGYEGLAIATLLAGFLLMIMALARCGAVLRFIPPAVITGFTTGIAAIIFSSQMKDFFGLQIDSLPGEFIAKWQTLFEHTKTLNPWSTALATGSLVLIFSMKRLFPRLPGAIFAIIAATLATFYWELPVETIGSKFGELPRTLPMPSIPKFSFEHVVMLFPDAVAIAMLGAIESLLSAAVADKMTGNSHRSNCELMAQGVANMGSVLFGGIPATGAIARTTANIKMNARTPFAGMIHAITLLGLMLFFAPIASLIPLASLAAVLVFVAWNMSELPHFIKILKERTGEASILLVTCLTTVLVDLTVAVLCGVILHTMISLLGRKRAQAKVVEVEAVEIESDEP